MEATRAVQHGGRGDGKGSEQYHRREGLFLNKRKKVLVVANERRRNDAKRRSRASERLFCLFYDESRTYTQSSGTIPLNSDLLMKTVNS